MRKRTKKKVQIGSLAVIIFVSAFFIARAFEPEKKTEYTFPSCDNTLWEHVWSPDRLHKILDCVEVTGKVTLLEPQNDGDIHISLDLDDQFNFLLNEHNLKEYRGSLILEPVCQSEVREEKATKACTNFIGHVTIPKVGDRIDVKGTFVLDETHGWNEIHPVTSIQIIK